MTRPLETETEYRAALKRVSVLMDLDPDIGTPEGSDACGTDPVI
jgi:HTH-type transcriptional regulator/antitoxin HigA